MRRSLVFHANLGMRLRGAYLSVHRRTNAHFAQFGMTSDQFVVLSLLAEEDGISQQELAHRSFSDPNTITAMLRLLEQRGLVRRETPVHDRRARHVNITPAGRRLAARLSGSLDRFHQEFHATVPTEHREIIHGWLARVAAVMHSGKLNPDSSSVESDPPGTSAVHSRRGSSQ